jgi:hypothetical protein
MTREKIFVGTHHKTGTVLMDCILRDFSNVLNISHTNMNDHRFENADAESRKQLIQTTYKNTDVLFFTYSEFFGLLNEKSKPFHLIRDPRDVVLSAARYHSRYPAPEQWLNEAMIGQKTYNQAMVEANEMERIKIESDNVSSRAIANMISVSAMQNMLTVKYENLCEPSTMFAECTKIAEHVGMNKLEKLVFIGSVVSNIPKMGVVADRNHQTSNGQPNQWVDCQPEIVEYLNQRFSREISELGYSLTS